MEEKTVLTRADLKILLGVRNLRLKALIEQGLPFIKINAERGSMVFLKSSVLTWLKSLEEPKKIESPPQKEVPQKIKLAGMGK